MHLLHNVIARINASGAIGAFELCTVANVYAGWANTHAFKAVDAIALVCIGFLLWL